MRRACAGTGPQLCLRLLHRVTVAGDVPAGVDGTPGRVVEGDATA
ncbi:hypothetical protein [Streptomyces sp. SLBN-118]|nr:hypothetical protein [Streptomyces sp. SLBN-118]